MEQVPSIDVLDRDMRVTGKLLCSLDSSSQAPGTDAYPGKNEFQFIQIIMEPRNVSGLCTVSSARPIDIRKL